MNRSLPVVMAESDPDGNRIPSGLELRVWRVLQTVLWLAGAGILVALLFAPELGIHAFWNVLIPAAPALLVVAPGVWRNVCPLGATGLLPRHLGISLARSLSLEWQGRLTALGVVLLFVIVPIRHVVLDTSGPATALVLMLLAVVALILGLIFQGKSGWCSGACPVHPVEKLYGQSPLFTPLNAHCGTCVRCVTPCPEAIPGGHPLSAKEPAMRRISGILLVGGFPGFIWGWFQVRDYAGDGWSHLGTAYAWPFGAMGVSLLAYILLRAVTDPSRQRTLIRDFAAAAVSCYYWFRLPALVGFGVYPGDGMLVDLTEVLPDWFPIASRAATTLLFIGLLVWWNRHPGTWTVRPSFAT